MEKDHGLGEIHSRSHLFLTKGSLNQPIRRAIPRSTDYWDSYALIAARTDKGRQTGFARSVFQRSQVLRFDDAIQVNPDQPTRTFFAITDHPDAAVTAM